MATARDIVLIGVLVFTLGLALFITHYMMSQSVDRMLLNTEINESAALSPLQSIGDNILPKFDYIVFVFFIALLLSLIISSWFVAGNPIFMFAYFLILTIAVALSAVFSNVWAKFTQDYFGTTVTHFAITNNILTYLPLYIAVVGFIGIIVMFAKPYFEGA